MTLVHEEEIKCPECGNAQSVRIWQTVNVTLDPQLKQDLLDGKINLFMCEACKFESFIPVALLYHDMGLKFCVQLVPFEHATEPDFLENYNRDGTLNIDEMFPETTGVEYMSIQHVVFSMDELARYVLFRDSLEEFHKNEPST